MVTRSDSDGIARPRNSDFLSDIRMTITLYKHMSTRLSKVRAPTHGGRARTGCRSASRTNLEGSHPIVFRVVFDLGEMQGLQHGRDVHPESPAKTLLQPIPPTDAILRGGIDPTLQRSRPQPASARRRFRGASSVRATRASG